MDYLELKISLSPKEPWSEIIVAQLAELGFESFMDFEDGVLAYGQSDLVSEKSAIDGTFLSNPSEEVTFKVETILIPHQNWNALWESDFEPVYVEEHVSILAPFHDKSLGKGLIVEIQPQMSFGTGHHQTTWMMSKSLFELDKMPEKVLDMGAGTGVLAIIAEKLGAKEVLAIDIEDWSAVNTTENAERNQCTVITSLCGDVALIKGKQFGLILANINKNVLTMHLPHYSSALEVRGHLLLSGFFDSDVDDLVNLAQPLGLEKVAVLLKDNWASIKFIKL